MSGDATQWGSSGDGPARVLRKGFPPRCSWGCAGRALSRCRASTARVRSHAGYPPPQRPDLDLATRPLASRDDRHLVLACSTGGKRMRISRPIVGVAAVACLALATLHRASAALSRRPSPPACDPRPAAERAAGATVAADSSARARRGDRQSRQDERVLRRLGPAPAGRRHLLRRGPPDHDRRRRDGSLDPRRRQLHRRVPPPLDRQVRQHHPEGPGQDRRRPGQVPAARGLHELHVQVADGRPRSRPASPPTTGSGTSSAASARPPRSASTSTARSTSGSARRPATSTTPSPGRSAASSSATPATRTPVPTAATTSPATSTT